jgi:type IV secretory pathway ATPase VirB11/archaellum biosynthesis ATPase
MLNPDGRLWIDRLKEEMSDTGERLSPEAAGRILRTIAHHVGAEVTPSSPILSAELPGGGERFEGLIPPIVEAPDTLRCLPLGSTCRDTVRSTRPETLAPLSACRPLPTCSRTSQRKARGR